MRGSSTIVTIVYMNAETVVYEYADNTVGSNLIKGISTWLEKETKNDN